MVGQLVGMPGSGAGWGVSASVSNRLRADAAVPNVVSLFVVESGVVALAGRINGASARRPARNKTATITRLRETMGCGPLGRSYDPRRDPPTGGDRSQQIGSATPRPPLPASPARARSAARNTRPPFRRLPRDRR